MDTVIPDASDSLPPSAVQPSRTERGRGRGRPRGSGRGRGRGRSRGRGRGRGRVSAGIRRRTVGQGADPSHEWRIVSRNGEKLVLEHAFIEDVIGERARLFCASAIQRINVEGTVRNLPDSRTGYFLLFADEVLRTCRAWLNEQIMLNHREVQPVSVAEMYQYVAVMLFSHCSGFSFEKTIDIMPPEGTKPLNLNRIRFISNKVLTFSATGRGYDGGISWMSQRDLTPLLTQFEKTASRTTCKMFVPPIHTLATLDDDLYRTRASNNQVKTISSRKADREGHTADAIADALFRITSMMRFRRRGVSQSSNVSSLLDAVLEGGGEHSLHGFIVTADRGYGKLEIIQELLAIALGQC